MGAIRNKLSGDTIGGETVPSVVATDVEVVKEGSIYAMRFNGSTSKIDCGDYSDLTGDLTFLAWVNVVSFGEAGEGRILDNGPMRMSVNSFGGNPIYLLSSDSGSNSARTATDSLKKYEWQLVAFVRRSDGTTNCYLDGILSNTADQDSGTPLVGTANITVGNNFAQTRTFDGDIAEVQVISGLLTAEEISQVYSSQKHLYGK